MSQHDFQVCEPCGSVVGPFTLDGTRYTQLGCCGRGPIQSGSRYSMWFCPDCKEQVGLLHGRHGFVSGVNAVAPVRDLLGEWRHPVVRRNPREIGVPDGDTIHLARYEELARERIDPDARFRELCAFLEEAGRQAAGREAR